MGAGGDRVPPLVMLPFPKPYHLRSAYPAPEKADLPGKAQGAGYRQRLLQREKGTGRGVYAMAFQDSHFKPMYMAGYGWQSIWRPTEGSSSGAGVCDGP